MKIKELWHKAFLEERSILSLSLFRLFVAFTVGAVMLPTFMHMADNYYPTAFKTYNTIFFPLEFVTLIQKSPLWVIDSFVCLFIVFSALFFVGFWSQVSCIMVLLTSYYFYALNSFAMGTLSWDILLVTLFLMCTTNYHGHYFSIDCLLRKRGEPYKDKRPFFIQRLLQLQIGFTFFYTALYKIYPAGNWLKDNPIYYIMNYPPSGSTKMFLLRDVLVNMPRVCYVIGVFIVLTELLLMGFLFWRRTRVSAIYAGMLFHITLLLTLDVPATFFFLFPAQLCLFINPENILSWVKQIRKLNAERPQNILVFDGQCQYCIKSVEVLRRADLFNKVRYIDLNKEIDLTNIHPRLTKSLALSQLNLIDPSLKMAGGFYAVRRLAMICPLLWPLVPVFYLPGMGIVGSYIYKFIAKNRYFFHFNRTCDNHACYR